MADKIVKAFEALRSHYLQESTQAIALAQKSVAATDNGSESPGPNIKKKDVSLSTRERINYCNVISDYLPMQTVRGINEFPRLLTLAMELLLVSCDDNNADVRLVAGESINKIMKALLDTNIGRIQVELYKEIKKNGSSRSLRAAMQRFSDTSHLIRAHKRRPYVANMLPCIVKIAKREDDPVQESLGILMLRVVPVLGSFMNEGDVKILLKTFIPNLKSASAATRRTAASSLNALCQNSRKPIHFYSWLISMLLGMITPLTDDLPVYVILGVLASLRSILPYLDTDQSKNAIKGSFGTKKSTMSPTHKKVQTLEKKQYLQIYEVTMFCTKHKDHNVVTAALETLYQVLQCHAKPLIEILLSPSGIAPTITGQLAFMGGHSFQRESLAPCETGDSGVPSDLQSLSSISLTSESTDGKDKSESLDISLDDTSLSGDAPMFSSIPVIPSAHMSDIDSAIEASSIDTEETEETEEKNESDDENEGLSLPRTYTTGSMVNIESDMLADPRNRLDSTFLDIHDRGSQTSLEEELKRNESICSSDVRTMIERQFNIDAVACTGVPLLNCVRLMCSFLLSGEPGKTLPDFKTRVSVKSLALHCIGATLKLFPEALIAKVLPDEFIVDENCSKQLVRDILLLRSHEDPQIKGAVSGVIGFFIQAAMTVSMGKYNSWNSAIAEQYETGILNLPNCIKVVINLFTDESAVAVKHNCHAAKYCILALIDSDYNMYAYELVRSILNLQNCSYWLVKTEILDILHQLDYRQLMIFEPHWVLYQNLSNLNKKYINIQGQVIDLMSIWLGDEDARVRQAAAVAIVKIIPNLYFAGCMENHNIECSALTFKQMKENCEVIEKSHEMINMNLSAVLRRLFELQDTGTSKCLIHGCIQCYYLLSETYPPTCYPYAWEILPRMSLKSHKQPDTLKSTNSARRLDFSPPKTLVTAESSTSGILNVTLDLISAGWMMSDLQAHQDTLKLCVHILCGASKPHLKSKESDTDQGGVVNMIDNSLVDTWSSLEDPQLITYAKRIFTHITRILHVVTHVIEQTNPLVGVKPTITFSAPSKDKTPLPGNVTNTSYTASPTINTSTPQQTPTAASPRKFTLPKAMQRRLDSDNDQSKTPDGTTSTSTSDAKQTSTSVVTPQTSDRTEKLGAFHHLPHFVKLYEILKGAYKNYQTSTVFSGLDKFNGFIRGTLEAFSMVLELSTFNELGTHAEEFLEYMKATAQVEEEMTFLAVQQLLKGLFGTNAASEPEVYILAASTKHLMEARGDPTFSIDKQSELTEAIVSSIDHNIYNGCFMSSYNEMCESLKMVPLADNTSLERGSKALNLFKSFKKNMSISRTTPKVSKERITSIQSYIRLFEPLVIHALKAYTTTSSTTLQCQAIHLLNQLIRLRVNYSLLDSDQVFIAFVLKQFEFINNGQISMPEVFIPTIFQFLVLLSYECYQPKFTQAKAIIGMPKIMRLCDEIMACEQPAVTHAIPALKPIVQDLFASHSQTRPDSAKDLDTQREVVVSMLLRVVQYPEVLQMLATVLNGSKSNDEKWKRLSRLIIDTLLPSLSKLEIQIQYVSQLHLLFSLLDGVAPLALRPADIILKSLFDVHLPTSLAQVTQALSMVVGLLRTLIMQNREDTIFSRMQQIDSSFVRPCFYFGSDTSEFSLKNSKTNHNSAQYLASFIIYFVDLAVQEICQYYNDLRVDRRNITVLVEMLKTFLVLITYIAKSGSFKILTSNILTIFYQKRRQNKDQLLFMDIHQKLSSINEQETSCFLKWLFCLQCLGVSDATFWRENFNLPSNTIMEKQSNKENITWKCHMIEKGSLLLYCDVITSQLKEQKNVDACLVESLLKNKISELMLHFDEPPVKELVSRILQNPELTTVFIQVVSASITPHFLRQQLPALKWLLHHLECVELSYSAAIINFLLKILPHIRIYGLSRKAETLACRRVEYIQSLPDQQRELSLADLREFSQNKSFMKRFPRLCSYIQRIDKTMSPVKMMATHPLDNAEVKNLCDYVVQQEWMRSFVEKLCFSQHENDMQRRSEVRLLRSLNLDDIQSIMEHEKFNLNLLEICIEEVFFTDEVSKHRARTATNSARMDLHENFNTGCTSERENREHLLNLSKTITMKQVHVILQDVVESQVYKEFNYLIFREDALRTLHSDGNRISRYLLVLRCVIKFLTPSCYYNQSWNLKLGDGLEVTKFILMLPLLCKQDLWNNRDVFVTFEICFHALSLLLHCQELSLCLMDQKLALILTRTIDAVYTLVEHLALNYGAEVAHLNKITKQHQDEQQQHVAEMEEECNPFRRSCEQVSDLVDALQNIISIHNFHDDRIPKFMICHLRKTIIGLARLSFVNSYVRIPPIVWKFGWDPTTEGLYNTELPPLPVDIMKEKDVLKEFVYRVNQIGWTSRMQYEETWAALLGVLSSPPVIEDSSTEEDIELAEASCLAVHCITSLLLETTLAPVPGNSAISQYSAIHRQREYPFLATKAGKKLLAIRSEIEMKLNEQASYTCNSVNISYHPVVPSLLSAKQRKLYLSNGCMMDAKLYISNLELSYNINNYSLGQISASAIRTRLVTSDVQEDTDSDDSDSVIIKVKEKSFSSSVSSDTPYRKLEELDIRSCLQFLLELFEQWLSPFAIPKTPLMLKMEAIKSLCVLSDLLLELNHYEWILGILVDFSQHHPVEDEILMQYLIPTVCKALAVLKLEGQLAERICRLIEVFIKSPNLPLQIACLAGSLYILESYVNSTNLILAPILTEFLIKKLTAAQEKTCTTDSKRHLTMLWTVAFYLLENCSSEIQDPQFASSVLEIAINELCKPTNSCCPGLFNILFSGLERLAVSQSLTRAECERLAKVASKCISIGSTDNILPSLGLLCTCMYTGKDGDQASGQPDLAEDAPITDSRLIVMERINVLLTRIRKGNLSEATLLSTILPRILLDFLPVRDVMNKLISEFLSSQQLRPELVGRIFNKVSDLLYKEGEKTAVRDWMFLCIGSFVQRTPLSMAVWSLTCFFVSCSTNPWLKSLFPFIVERKGKFTDDDRKLFTMAALDFYTTQNLDEEQKKQFIQTFRSKADHPSSPYEVLISCCLKSSQVS